MIYVSQVPGPWPQQVPTVASPSLSLRLAQAQLQPPGPSSWTVGRASKTLGTGGHGERDLCGQKLQPCSFQLF